MRLFLVCIFCLICFPLGGRVEGHAAPLFRLHGEVIAALEGGPVIIKATLVYQGNDGIEIHKMSYYNAKIRNAKNWEFRLKACPVELIGSSIVGCATIAPGAKLSEYLVVHDHCEVPVGKCKVDLAWALYNMKDKNGKVISDPSTRLVVNVLPATADNLAALRDRLVKRVRQPEQSEVVPDRLADMVLFTRHRELLPVAWAMIEKPSTEYPFGALFSHIYNLSPPDDVLHERVIRLISRLSWRGWKSHPFCYWRSHKTTLPPKCLKTLMDDPDLWIRALTYETFGDQCDITWVRSLLSDLRQAANPLHKEQFVRILAELDDDRFQIRETATTKLIQLAPRVENQLKHYDQASLPPEAARRVRWILEKIAKERQVSPPWCVLRCLDVEAPEPRTFAILRALSEGPADSWLTKEATTRLSAKLKGCKSE